MRKRLRWSLGASLLAVALAALVLGGYRAATIRRRHYELASVNYRINLQGLRLQQLQSETRARSADLDPSSDPAYRALKGQMDLHTKLADAYREAARSPLAWLLVHPVARLCDCGFCDFIERNDSTPRDASP